MYEHWRGFPLHKSSWEQIPVKPHSTAPYFNQRFHLLKWCVPMTPTSTTIEVLFNCPQCSKCFHQHPTFQLNRAFPMFQLQLVSVVVERKHRNCHWTRIHGRSFYFVFVLASTHHPVVRVVPPRATPTSGVMFPRAWLCDVCCNPW